MHQAKGINQASTDPARSLAPLGRGVDPAGGGPITRSCEEAGAFVLRLTHENERKMGVGSTVDIVVGMSPPDVQQSTKSRRQEQRREKKDLLLHFTFKNK